MIAANGAEGPIACGAAMNKVKRQSRRRADLGEAERQFAVVALQRVVNADAARATAGGAFAAADRDEVAARAYVPGQGLRVATRQ